jgi:hypothetical protein
VDSLPSIHRNGQRRHPPIRKERHKGGYFVSLFEIRCSRKVLGRANGRENRNPEDRGAKQLLLVVAGRGEVRSRNGRSQESGGISGDGRDGTRGMDEGENTIFATNGRSKKRRRFVARLSVETDPLTRRVAAPEGWVGKGRSDREWRCENGALKP